MKAIELVEGVAGEGRGAAALAEHRPALDVAERRQAEQQPGGEEDQRRQPEAAVGDDAEREVDREADRRVGGGEQLGNAEAALEQTIGLPASPAGGLPGLAHRPILAAIQSRPAPTREEGEAHQEPDRSRAAAVDQGHDQHHQPDQRRRRARSPRTAPAVDRLAVTDLDERFGRASRPGCRSGRRRRSPGRGARRGPSAGSCRTAARRRGSAGRSTIAAASISSASSEIE